MDPEFWRRVQAIFEAAVQLAPDERAALIEDRCGSDAELRRAVDTLFRADATGAGALDQPPVAELVRSLAEASEQQWVGTRLGPYRIVDVVGRGGMGTVFRAERDDDHYDKTVAIKVVAMAALGEHARGRLETERRILAGLTHPDIARLLDGGTTADGSPYLVMDYVEGETITRYARGAQLSVRERVKLLARVCRAVQHAHQNLVVHRDIKPSNILVTPSGEPKLLDFGIAKLLDQSSERARLAMTMTVALTPGYASPEQLVGRPITTATDVYSLGVLAYMLLCDRLPHDWEGETPEEVARQLEQSPLSPSQVWRLRQRDETAEADRRASGLGATAGTLVRELEGDLDNVVLRSLQVDPAERYGSGGELAEDLERYLAGFPVEARPATWSYLLSKFVRRNAMSVAAGGLALFALVAFSLTTLFQARELERERDSARLAQDRAEEITEFLLESYRRVDPQHNRGETVTAREVLDDAARRIEHELADQPELQAELMHTLGKVNVSLGLYDDAEALIHGAQEIRERRFGEADERTLESLHQWGRLLYQRARFDDALAVTDQLLGHRRPPHETASDLQLRAQLQMAFGKFDDALVTSQRALDIRAGDDVDVDLAIVGSLAIRGQALQALRRHDEAEETLRQALELQAELVSGDNPVSAAIISRLADIERERNDPAAAERLAREALAMRRRLHGEDHPLIALNLGSLANILMLKGDLEQAAALYEESQRLQRELWGPQHPRLAMMLHNQAFMWHRRLGQPARAEPLIREAIAIWDKAYGDASRDHPNMGFFLVALGEILTDSGRAREAEPVLRQALDLRLRLGQGESRNGATTRSALANSLLGQRRYREAEELLLAAYPVLEDAIGNSHRITRRALQRLVELYAATDRPDHAERYRELLAAG